MGRPIDEKIVKMKLDNADFRSKADETISIFGRIKETFAKITHVDLSKTSKELSGIGKETANIPMSKLQSSIETVSNRFTTLGIIGMTALQNITNKAMDAGEKMLKALSIEGAQAGFKEYELKMGSIQTILANTQGKNSLTDVTDTLKELNEYSDKTIYSFADMTQNIGRFTAAGVGLEASTTAIKGISNLAAVSGSNAGQASTAMYQLSQELASGRVTLMGWNSVVNAGMGGKIFQDALTKTADGLGIARDKSVSFRDSLQDGWLTSEVLLATLKDFSTDASMLEAATKVRTFTQLISTAKEAIQSGWGMTWELLIGDFNEATNLWSGLNDTFSKMIGESADKRNKLIGDFVAIGGMKNVFRGIGYAVEAVVKVFGSARDGFRAIFPEATANSLKNLSETFVVFTDNLRISDKTAGKLKTVFEGVFSVFSTGWEIANTLGKSLKELIPDGIGGGALDFLVKIAQMAIDFNKAVKEGNALTDFIEDLGTTFSKFSDKIKEFNIFEKLTNGYDTVKTALGKVGGLFGKFLSGIGLKEVAGVGAAGGIFLFGKKIFELLDKLMNFIKAPEQVKNSITGLFKSLGGSLDAFTSQVKYTNLMMVAVALGILAISLKVLETISWQDMGKGLIALGLALGGMFVAMNALSKIDMKGFGAAKIAVTLIALAVSVGIISLAIKAFAKLDTTQLATGMLGIAGVVVILVGAMKALSKLSSSMKGFSGAKIAVSLVALSISVGLMAASLKLLSSVDAQSLVKGGLAITLITTVLVVAFAALGKLKSPSLKSMASFIAFTIGLQQAAIAMIIFAGALHILIPAVKKIGEMDLGVLQQGLIGMTVALVGVGLAMRLSKGSFSGAAGMLVVVGALMLLIPLIERFGTMNLNILGTGMASVAVSLGLLVIALNLANGTMGGALALVIAAGALMLLTGPLVILGNLSITQVATALITLGGALLIIGGLGMLLTPVIPALLGLAIALALIGGSVVLAGLGLSLLSIGLMAFTGVVATAVVGLVVSFGTLLDGLITLAPKVGAAISAVMQALLDAIIQSAPKMVMAAGILILSLLTGILTFLPQIMDVGVAILLALIGGLIKAVPVLIAAAVMLMISFVSGLSAAIRDNGPKIVQEILKLIGEIIAVVVEAIIAVIDTFVGWIPGVSEELGKASDAAAGAIRDRFDGETLGKDLGTEFVDGVASTAKDAGKAGLKMGTQLDDGTRIPNYKKTGKEKGLDFSAGVDSTKLDAMIAGLGIGAEGEKGTGLADFLGSGKTEGMDFSKGIDLTKLGAFMSGEKIADKGAEGAKTGDFEESGIHSGRQYNSGVASYNGRVRETGKELATSGKAGADSVDTTSSGKNFGQGYVNGIHSLKSAVERAAREMGRAGVTSLRAAQMERSPSKLTTKSGLNFGQGYVNGIKSKIKGAGDVAAEMANNALRSMDKFIGQFAEKFIPEEESAYEFKLKPILDLDGMGAYPDQRFGLTPDVSKANIQLDRVVAGKGQNGDKNIQSTDTTNPQAVTNNTYDIHVAVTGDLPSTTIKRMANQIQAEIKNANDRDRMSRGEAVSY